MKQDRTFKEDEILEVYVHNPCFIMTILNTILWFRHLASVNVAIEDLTKTALYVCFSLPFLQPSRHISHVVWLQHSKDIYSDLKWAGEISCLLPWVVSPLKELPTDASSFNTGIMGGFILRVTVILNPFVVWIVAPVVISTCTHIYPLHVSEKFALINCDNW